MIGFWNDISELGKEVVTPIYDNQSHKFIQPTYASEN